METNVVVAAKWWADQLRTRTKQDNGEVMASMLATLASQRREDPLRVDVFERELLMRLDRDTNEHLDGCVTLSCDYGAEGLLRDAAKAAGIVPMCPPFPMKTTMWVRSDSVTVRHGYGAEVQMLWSQGS